MWISHEVRENFADPEWANLALLDSVASVCSLVFRRIARCHWPLSIAPTAMADMFEMWKTLRERRMEAVRLVPRMRIELISLPDVGVPVGDAGQLTNNSN